MYSAQRCIRIATTLLIFWMISCEIALPQTVSTRGGTGASFLLAHLPSAPERCAQSAGSSAVPRADGEVAGDAPSLCGALPTAMPAVKPCDAANRAGTGCEEAKELAETNLEAMGKDGQKILRARERVLEILQTENACSAWFRGKDSNPDATFRTLSFTVDRKGEDFVLESRNPGDMTIFRNPYVARVFQGDGSYATITINLRGAFFSPMARVVEVQKEGGPWSLRGTRVLGVGPYAGDSMRAQILALLHEFGHLVDLLPTDEGDQDGKSVQNTSEVLRFCRAEVEAKAKRGALSAAR